MPLFRKTDPLDFPTTMAGAKLGDRLLVLGCGDAPLIVALASKVGLTGRSCIVGATGDQTSSAARIAEREGALVEPTIAPFTRLPFEDGSFDLVVVREIFGSMEPDARIRTAREAQRVLRPGGRCVVIEDAPREGLAALLTRRRPEERYATPDVAQRLLEEAGFAAVRTLAQREGLVFVEGVIRNPSK
jgi:ubiquinone/menaquinone biosynthesis C-methylase UbiE